MLFRQRLHSIVNSWSFSSCAGGLISNLSYFFSSDIKMERGTSKGKIPAKSKKMTQTTLAAFDTPSTELGDGVFTQEKVIINSWNLNGVRAVIKKGSFEEYFKDNKYDIVCFNETKVDDASLAKEKIKDAFPSEFHHYWNCCKVKKGYAGTAILSKVKPLSCKYGIGIDKHDGEGRAITLEFDKFFVVATYIPNAMQGLKRLTYRTEEWDVDFRNYLNQLREKKPTIWCGDLNVAHQEIDIANPKTNKKSAGFTDQERESFTETLEAGWVDTFRHLNPTTVKYSWWSMKQNAREKNVGWRLDYFVVNKEMIGAVVDSTIQNEVIGSDHCPIELEIDLTKL